MTDSANTTTSGAGPGSPGTGPATPGGGSKPPMDSKRKALWVSLGVVAAVILVFVMWKVSKTVTVPSVLGLTQVEATQKLDAAALKLGRVTEEATIAVAPGTIFLQSPMPDSKAAKDSAVDVVVAPAPVVAVPNVVGTTESEAELTLASAGLRTGAVTGVFSDSKKAGTVMSQTPAESTEVTVASMVNLEISLGAKQGAVPDVVGLTSTDAKTVIEAAHFATSEAKSTSTEVDAGLVITQSPTAGTVAAEKSTVKITVSTGAPAPAEPATPPSSTATEPATTPPSTTATSPATSPKPETPKPETVSVPEVIGSRVLDAVRTLRQAKLGFKIAWGPTTQGFLKIAEQNPKAASSVDPGTVVTITVGLPEFLLGRNEVQPLPATEPATPSVTPESGVGVTTP